MPYSVLLLIFLLSSCEVPILNQEKLSDYQSQNRTLSVPGQFVSRLNIYVQMKWVKGPFGSPMDESVFELRFLDSDGEPASIPTDVEIFHYGWMPYMGHGTADDGILRKVATGYYRSEEFYFNMPGLWDIHFQFEREGTLLNEIVFRYTF